jgi:DNA repair protein RadC
MTGTRVSAVTAYTAHRECTAAAVQSRGHRVRELVCSYRPVRDHEGRIISVPSLALNTPHAAAQIIAPLMADQPVEMFAVACLSAKNRLLAWHIVSRGTRSSTPVSIPDVFVPACVTPGTVSLLVVHNHPSGDPTPSPDDIALTARLESAAAVLDFSLVDHLIVGENQRYFSFRAAGRLGATPADR